MSAVNVESGKATGGTGSGGGGGGNTGGGEDGMNDLYKVNQVWYRMIPSLSLVSKRTLLVNQAQATQYVGTNNPIIFNFNTGEYYTAMKTSYFYIQLGFNSPGTYGATKALISQGNILSLFEEIIFTSASGTEVERQSNKGLNSSFTLRYCNDQVYLDTLGQVQGAPYGPYSKNHDGITSVPVAQYGPNFNVNGTGPIVTHQTAASVMGILGGSDFMTRPRVGPGAQFYDGTRTHNLNVYSTQAVATGSPRGDAAPNGSGASSKDLPGFLVPMNQLLGVFEPYMNCLFPAGLLSGGRLELRWKKTSESIHFVGAMPIVAGGATSDTTLAALINAADNALTVKNCYIVFDAFQLQDNVLKRLNQTAAGPDGLSMLFDTYDHVLTNFQGTGGVECQVSQARSRVVRSWNVIRDNQAINNPYINSFAAEASVRRMSGLIPAGYANPIKGPLVLETIATSNVYLSGGLALPVVTNTTANGDFSQTATVPFLSPLPDDIYGITAGGNSWGKPIVSSYQAQLGALFFPQQPITTTKEHYQNALYVWGMGIPDSRINCSVTLEDFMGGIGNGVNQPAGAPQATPTYTTNPIVDPTIANNGVFWVEPWGLAIFGALMEKSQALQLSGLPLSNARLLRHKFKFDFLSLSGTRAISTFTQFTRVVKVFLGGRVVVRE